MAGKGNAVTGGGQSRCRYPKDSAHPSMGIGGTAKGTTWPKNHNVKYPGKGPTGNKLETSIAKTLVCHGQSTAAPGSDYPGEWSYSKSFGAVKKLSGGK